MTWNDWMLMIVWQEKRRERSTRTVNKWEIAQWLQEQLADEQRWHTFVIM